MVEAKGRERKISMFIFNQFLSYSQTLHSSCRRNARLRQHASPFQQSTTIQPRISTARPFTRARSTRRFASATVRSD